ADLIGRLYEGPSDVMVADNPELKRQPRFLRVTDRGRHARIRNRDDDIRIDMAFARQFSADAFARLVDARPFNDAVGPREINMLEDANPAFVMLERHPPAHPAGTDDDNLAGFDVAFELGPDDVERTGLRSQNPRLADPAQDQWPHPE